MTSQSINPKPFQREKIDNIVQVFDNCLSQVSRVKGSERFQSSRRLIVGETGYVLLEAPTGSGKTLIAAKAMERISTRYPILWFWFAPFSGVTDQAARFIQGECSGLSVRSIETERDIETLEPGCVYVLTWGSVAAKQPNSRVARKRTETAPPIDLLLQVVRQNNIFIGTVIDEAHHSFKANTEAFSFFQKVLDPDVTLLATATPRDEDVKRFIQELGIKHPNRVSISRQQGIDADLIKLGIRAFTFRTRSDEQELIDFRKTALERGVETHRQIKAMLLETGVNMTPLLLVQVDSSTDSIPIITQWLMSMGFRDEQVRVHTAEEPDPYLLSIALDESVEVLIFKMAVATGFDVPRAFTLVSMRTSRDPQFGVQIVGRIMRVDRRLQGRMIPEPLRYGYVFLANREVQGGLVTAAQRINAIRDELATVSVNVSVIELEPNSPVAIPSPGGQLSSLDIIDHIDHADTGNDLESNSGDTLYPHRSEPHNFSTQPTLFDENENYNTIHLGTKSSQSTSQLIQSRFCYPLRHIPEFPHVFKRAQTAILPAEQFEEELVNRIHLDDQALNRARQSAIQIYMDNVDIFGGQVPTTEHVLAPLSRKQIAQKAQATIFAANEDGLVDVRKLNSALIKKLKIECTHRGWSDMLTDEALQEGIEKILALKPQMLFSAVSKVLADHIEIVDGAEIPDQIISDEPLAPSRLNVYGVIQNDLNTWEKAFVEELETDDDRIIQWWYRNLPRKPYSVCLPLPGQPDFYPDFIVGVSDRTRGDGILLVEIKRVINDEPGNAAAKAQANHPVYKKVMMLYRDHDDWQTVEYDEDTNRNIRHMIFRLQMMRTY